MEYTVPVVTADGPMDIPFKLVYSLEAPHIELVQEVPGSIWVSAPRNAVHHLGYWADDVAATGARLEQAGYTLEARPGGDAPPVFAYYLDPLGRPDRTRRQEQLRRLAGLPSDHGALMTGIHRERPGAADLSSATGAPAVALGDDIWMSPGVSNAYAVGTDAGRVIVNTGLAFEGPLHRRAFDAVIPGRTATIIVTQGHPDHWGGIGSVKDSDTEIVMHSNYHYWRDDMARLSTFRAGHTGFAFAKFGQALMEHLEIGGPDVG